MPQTVPVDVCVCGLDGNGRILSLAVLGVPGTLNAYRQSGFILSELNPFRCLSLFEHNAASVKETVS